MALSQEQLDELRASWNGVRMLQDRIQRTMFSGFGGAAAQTVILADMAHNLPFLHACGVLNDALEHLAKDMNFEYQHRELGRLMEASQGRLGWQDYDQMKEIKTKRNDLAHRGVVSPRADCWKYIKAIEAELKGWGIVK